MLERVPHLSALFGGIALLGALITLPAYGLDLVFSDGFETGDTLRWACVNLECFQIDCSPGPQTSLTGTVFAPNGTLPLPNVTVYIPNAPVGPLPAGAQCNLCATPPLGSPLVSTTTASDGSFTLTDVPSTTNVPLVLLTGKWRRQIVIANVPACAATPIAGSATRLPRNSTEGDLPRIAVSTGAADALECLLRKIGIDDSEFTVDSQGGRVHLWAGTGGTDAFDAGHGGLSFTASTALWDSAATLQDYDAVLLSCEGSQNSGTKPPASRAALKAYADAGGRVFAEHLHNYWIQAGPTPWDGLATWNLALAGLGATVANVNASPPRSGILADWLFEIGASGSVGSISLQDTKHTATAVNGSLVADWIDEPTTANGLPSIQYFSFTTPVESAASARCGRVVFSDTHTISGDQSNASLAFPSGGCISPVANLAGQEKLLAFMLFDLGACTGAGIE